MGGRFREPHKDLYTFAFGGVSCRRRAVYPQIENKSSVFSMTISEAVRFGELKTLGFWAARAASTTRRRFRVRGRGGRNFAAVEPGFRCCCAPQRQMFWGGWRITFSGFSAAKCSLARPPRSTFHSIHTFGGRRRRGHSSLTRPQLTLMHPPPTECWPGLHEQTNRKRTGRPNGTNINYANVRLLRRCAGAEASVCWCTPHTKKHTWATTFGLRFALRGIVIPRVAHHTRGCPFLVLHRPRAASSCAACVHVWRLSRCRWRICIRCHAFVRTFSRMWLVEAATRSVGGLQTTQHSASIITATTTRQGYPLLRVREFLTCGRI